MKKQIKALLLFSGGLDSLLALKVAESLNISVTLLIFKSYFFDEKIALKAIKENKLKNPYLIIDFSKKHFQIVKQPKFGYGKNMNPCIDCHLLMLKEAKKIKEKEGYDLILTGEVLNERPMSQNMSVLNLLEKESGLEGYLLRPLSALSLKPTILEKEGAINRKQLLNIKGRSRKVQLNLVQKFNLQWFPLPAGGCLLTDPQFSLKLKDLLNISDKADENDINLLKIGRHFIVQKTKIILGRNQKENEELKKFRKEKDVLIEMENYPGPTALIRNYQNSLPSQDAIQKAKELIIAYAPKVKGKNDIIFHQLNI